MLRTCKDCQIQKNIDEFYKKNYKKNNYVWIAHICSECKKNKDALPEHEGITLVDRIGCFST